MSQLEAHLALADLAKAILHSAQSPAGGATVAIVDALPAAVAVLQPLVRGAGGTFLDLNEIARAGIAEPSEDAAIHGRIEATVSAGSPDAIRIRADDTGLLRAFYDSDGGDRPSEDIVLAAATSALSPAFAQAGLVVVAYDETGEDASLVKRVWTFLRLELASMAPEGTTLVVLCGTDHIDYDRMCGQPPSGRFFVQGDACLQRNVEVQDNNTIRFLATGHADEHLVMFLGAGFSASSELALGDELRDIALREYLSEDLKPRELLPAQFYDEVPTSRLLPAEIGRSRPELAQQLTLERVLRELTSRGITASKAIAELESKHGPALAAPGPAVRHLHRLLEGSRRKLIIVTVNFDQLVEHGQDANVKTFVTDAEFGDASAYIARYLAGGEDMVPLLKVHGSIEQPETLVFNIERTEAGLPPNRIAALQTAFSPLHDGKIPIAYVGASMRDQDLTPLLTAPSHIDSTDEYWISPLPTATVLTFWERTARLARWRDTNRAHDVDSRFVTKTADDALSYLADALAP